VDKWTSSLEDSRASHSQLLESVKQLTIPDTCSHTSETESGIANLELFSSKTSKESSQPRQQTESPFSSMSSQSWKAWVTEQRQEYSQRVKSAHLIRESESSSLGWSTPIVGDAHLASNPEAAQKRLAEGKSTLSRQVEAKSWPTARTSDAEGGRIETEMTSGGFKSKRHKSNQTFGAKLRDAVETHEEKKNWATPNTMDHMAQRSPEALQRQFETTRKGRTAPANLREQVHPRNWPTITVNESHNTPCPSQFKRNTPPLGTAVLLDGHPDQVNPSTSGRSQESWPTPRANKVHPEITEENREHLANRKKSNLEEDIAGHCGKATGKLNPNWVEHLMGLPAGWTDLGCWETE
jgi:hypothetical protein